jgi:hypothetical protein
MSFEDADYDADLLSQWRGWPCVIYVRISAADIRAVKKARRAMTREEHEAALLAKVHAHLADCRAVARDNGMRILAEFVERNMPASRSGRRGRRLTARENLMAWLAARPAVPVAVLTTEVERLYRDVGEGQEMVAEAERILRVAGRATLVGLGFTSYETRRYRPLPAVPASRLA